MKKFAALAAATAIVALGIVAIPTTAQAATTVTVTVVDASTDLPLPDAVVMMSSAGDPPDSFTRAADDNGVAVEAVPGNSYYVYASAPGYGTEYWDGTGDPDVTVPLDTTSGPISITIELDPEATISGTVYSGDGSPAVTPFITIITGSGVYVGVVQGDANGEYTITGLADRTVILRADAYFDDNSVGEFFDDELFLADADPISVTAGDAVTGIDFHLDEGGAVEGTITNTNGSAIPLPMYAEQGGNGISADDLPDPVTGEYRIDKLYTAEWLVRPEQGIDFWVPQSVTLPVTEGEITEHDFVLEPALIDESAFINDPQTPPISGPTTVEPGKTYEWTVDAQGEVGDTYAFIYSEPTFLAAATPVGGEVTFSLTIPADTDPGTHALLFTGHDELYFSFAEAAWFEIEVAAAALPATGAEPTLLVGLGALLLLAGGGAVVLHRRETESATA